jgi:hypothetical protein
MPSEGPIVERPDLRADCANCFALCCVALRFDASPDFAFSKPAGTPCSNLASDLRCTIHAELGPRGFPGCAVYDCQGAGQKVSQITLGGRDWRTDPKAARWMIVVYPVVRQLHEILGYLVDALDNPAAIGLCPDVEAAIDRINRLTYLTPEALLRVDIDAQRADVARLLDRISELAERPASAG